MQILDIAEVARRSGLPASTLRFYEEKGLIRSIGRCGLRRAFNPGVLHQLAGVPRDSRWKRSPQRLHPTASCGSGVSGSLQRPTNLTG